MSAPPSPMLHGNVGSSAHDGGAVSSTTSVGDDDVRRLNWQGMVPCRFTLAAHEVATYQPPEPFYLLAPRQSYFPLLTAVVREHFLPSTSTRIDELWLEAHCGDVAVPLRWHLPVGVLFDLHASADALPWQLTVHFQSFPDAALLRCAGEATVKSHYLHTLKESCFMRHGDGRRMNDLSVADADALWDGVRQHAFDTFTKTFMVLAPRTQLARDMRQVPVRVVRPNLPVLQPNVAGALVDAGGGGERETTLAQLLAELLPSEFAAAAAAATSNSANTIADGAPLSTTHRALVHGVSPPGNTPLVWLAINMVHPDGFVYVTVLPK